MNVRKVSVSYGRTQNTGDFSGLRYDVTFEADLDDDEDINKAARLLRELAKAEVVRSIQLDAGTLTKDWPAKPRGSSRGGITYGD